MQPLISLYQASSLYISVDSSTISEEWGLSSGYQRKDGNAVKWITLDTLDDTFDITLFDIAKFLQCPVGLVDKCLQTPLGTKKIEILLYHKFIPPNWKKLETIFRKTFPPTERKSMFELMVKTVSMLMKNSIVFLNLPETPTHFTRNQLDLPLPLEVGIEGNLYVILKPETHSEPFAKGGYKKVYYAVNLNDFSLAAWAKVLMMDAYEKALVENELYFQNQLTSKGVVQLYHHTYYSTGIGDKAGLMMEYCNTDLEKILSCPLTIKKKRKLWTVFQDVFEALAEMEEKKIHHRDIKPSNIFIKFIRNQWRGKIGDFGLATNREKEKDDWKQTGTFCYMSPDYCKGIQIVENCYHPGPKNQSLLFKWLWLPKPKTMDMDELEKGIDLFTSTINDVWSLGITLFEVRTLEDPHTLISDDVDSETTQDDLFEAIRNITQERVNSKFSDTIEPNSLEELNLMMLGVDNDKRITARKCNEICLEMRKRSLPFK